MIKEFLYNIILHLLVVLSYIAIKYDNIVFWCKVLYCKVMRKQYVVTQGKFSKVCHIFEN